MDIFRKPHLRARYESFGGIVALDETAATLYVDKDYMQEIGYRHSPLWKKNQNHLTAPLTAHFSITNHCPMGCRTCYNASGGKALDEMPVEDIKQTLEELARMQVFTVAFGGGEPLSHAGIFKLARYTRKLGMTPTMTTNGYYINPYTAWKCRVFSHVHVSMDGVGDIYKAVRGVDGFSHAGRGLKLLKSCGVSVGVNIVVCRANYNHLEDIVRYCVDLGVNDFIFLRLKPGGRAISFYEDQKLTQNQRLNLIPMLERITDKFDIHCHVDCAMMPFVFWHHPDMRFLQLYAGEGCVAGNEIIEINPMGQVSACSFAQAPACNTRQLTESWETAEGLRRYRGWIHNTPEPCCSCQYLALCRGGCRALAETITGDFYAPDPECPFVLERRKS